MIRNPEIIRNLYAGDNTDKKMNKFDAHMSVKAKTTRMITATKKTSTLSPRELNLLRLYSEGNSTQDIMRVLGLGKSTLRSYEERAIAKLGAKNRNQAIAICIRTHIL